MYYQLQDCCPLHTTASSIDSAARRKFFQNCVDRARVSPLPRSQVVGVEGGRPRLERCCSAAGRRGGAVAEQVRRLGLEESDG
jgi:hypothetical protein